MSCTVYGQSVATDETISEKEYLQDFPIVLSASRLAQPLSEAPNAMTVIDQSMIKASGFRNIADLFRLVPGMYVGYLNGYTPIVSYHGTTDNYARRMQVLVDGRSVYLPPFGGVTWEDLPLFIDDIERIEVIRGPAAASHGANSTQGVINIITRDASGANGGKASFAKGGNGVADVSAGFGRTGSELDYRFSLGSRADNGYDLPTFNERKLTRLVNFRSNYHPNGIDSVDTQIGYSSSVRGEGVLDRWAAPFRDIKTSADYQQIAWSRVLSQGDEVRLQYSHTHTSFNDDSVSTVPDITATTIVPFPQLNIVTQRHDAELQHTTQWSTGNRLVWGAGIRYDGVDAPLGFGNSSPLLRQSRIFAHDEWRVTPAALFNLGAMWEDDGMGHRNTSPRISFNYHLLPQHTVRIGSSLAYRNPAALEEFANTQPEALRPLHAVGGLRPEKMLSKEIGYIGEFPSVGITADTRIYSDQLSDLIYIDPVLYNGTPAISFKNLYTVSFQGWESTIKYHWGMNNSLVLNYSRQQASCGGAGLSTYYSAYPQVAADYQNNLNVCPNMVPANSASLLASQQLGNGLMVSAGYYYQSELQVMDAAAPQTAMRRVDIKITQSFGNLGKSGGGEVALVAQNLFQDNYTEYANIPERLNLLFNRRAYITATLHF